MVFALLKMLDLMSFKSDEPCVCCGESREDYVCYHHIITQKKWPELANKKWNMIPVCQIHHNEFHQYLNMKMCAKYKSVKEWFRVNGWYEDAFNCLRHELE